MDIHYAFRHAKAFNQDLSQWNATSLQRIEGIFWGATSFNQPLGQWDTSKVQDISYIFTGTPFNQPLSSWNVSRATRMHHAFQDSAFNQDISRWNVSNMHNLYGAFMDAKNFSQNLCAWGSLLPLDANVADMFKGTACPNTSDPVLPHGPLCWNDVSLPSLEM